MIFWPVEKFDVNSSLNSKEIIFRFLDCVKPINSYSRNTVSKEFEGNFSQDYIVIRKIINYRNSFLPEARIQNKVSNSDDTVKVVIKISGGVVTFVILWCLFAGFMSIVLIIQDIKAQSFSAICLGPLLMILFCYIIVISGYNLENKDLKEFVFKNLQSTDFLTSNIL